MDKNTFYAVTALFDSPDSVLHAVEEVRKAGYTLYDVNTPYPLHGMDRAMRLKPSRLGYLALAFGIVGTLSAVGLMTWVSLVDYPMVIGGKPFWSWPAFVPVAFELTVLLASVLSVVSMIVLYFKFPNLSHPLHDSPYMKHVSSDMFGIYIRTSDPIFDAQKVTALFRGAGAKHIDHVHYDLGARAARPRILDPRFIGVLAVTGLVAISLTYFSYNKLLTMVPFTWMSDQVKLKAQEPSSLFSDGIGMRPPVEGTVARGFIPYPYHGKPDEAARFLVNPLTPSRALLERGKEKYLTFCSPCHGNFGAGDSRLRGQFPNPPTLHSEKVRDWPDGSIYHVITDGQNVMPSYASQISRDDRWAIVQFIRVLQRAHHAKESDLK